MNHNFSTEKMKAMLPAVQAFLETNVFPFETDWLQGDPAAMFAQLDQLRATVRQNGWWLPQMPTDLGGLGMSLAQFGALSEVLGQSILGHYLFNCQAPDAGNMELLHQYGSATQQTRWLQPVANGAARSCFGMTEPDNAGSNPTNLSTSAVLEGDHYVLNGRKWFTSGAEGAAFCIVMAVTHPDAPPHARASMIIVPADTPGFERVRNVPVMGDGGFGWMSHAEMRLTDCRVPAENLIGEAGKGFLYAQHRLGPGRIHHCMRWLGICRRALDLMCRRAVERELGNGKRLTDQQTIQHWIAESHAEMQAARALVLQTAEKIDALGQDAARADIHAIKFFVAGVLGRVLDRAIQTHGAFGITDDFILSWFYRHERGARIYDGPDEVHKNALAKLILKQYAR